MTFSAADLPDGFGDTFTNRFVDAHGLRQHAVIGGEGPPLLLIHGWPQNWSAWRLVMPALAEHFEVIAPDQRGVGETEKPQDGYDPGYLAEDMVALMGALGHERFAVVGTDTGLPIAYALAADHPDRVACAAFAEVPGPPGAVPQPPFFLPEPLNNRLWHIPVNRLDKLNEQLVTGREDLYFGYEFAVQTDGGLPQHVIDFYVGLLRDPDALRGTFAFYREWDTMMVQNAERAKRPLTMPVLGIGGESSNADQVANAFRSLADDVKTAVIPGAGHWFAEEAPEATVQALTAFLAAYREEARPVASA